MHYKTAAEREVKDTKKFDARTRPGIFMGYELHSGGRWSGDGLVIDAEIYSSHDDKLPRIATESKKS